MNDKRIIYILLPALHALLLSSCAQEELHGLSRSTEDTRIAFYTSIPLPEVGTRSDHTIFTDSLKNGFHVTAICDEDETKIDKNGNIRDYFTEQKVEKTEGMEEYFRSDACKWPENKDNKESELKFFAFYPSREVMRMSIDEDKGSNAHFNLANYSTKKASTTSFDYRMEKFRVNKDISRHIDFVTATEEGSKFKNLYSGVNLQFEHQLSRVVLKAWGKPENDCYSIEIAGVRIGCAVVESDFNFAGTPENFSDTTDITTMGRWLDKKKDCVEYIFRKGDTVFPIDKLNNNSNENPKSIMGNGGWAMVIPYKHSKWDYTTDPRNDNKGLYFSILMRIKDENGMLIYPYVEGSALSSTVSTDEMNVVYLSVDKTNENKVVSRLYKKKGKDEYFTDPDCSDASAYPVPDTEEVRNYGWAAVPIQANWKAGCTYTYTLDYSNGVGVEDPADPYSGEWIIFKTDVEVAEESGETDSIVTNFSEGNGKDGQTVDITIE